MQSRNKTKRKSRIELHEFLHQHPSKSATTFHYEGSDQADKLRDTSGRDHIFTDDGNDDVVIQGNTAQSMHSGDHVSLGSGDDRLKVTASQGRNYFDSGSGDDVITDSQSDLYGSLGDGDDIYKYAGGNDFITLGSGKDKIHIKTRNNPGQLIVHDFSVATDKITGIRRKNGSFSWNDTLQAFTLDHKNDNLDITLYSNDDAGKAMSREFWLGLGLLNRKDLKVKSQTAMEWQEIRNRYAKYAIDESLTYYDWDDFKSNKKAIHKAFDSIAWSYGDHDVSKSDLSKAIDLASTSGSYQSFIDASLDLLS